MWTCNTMYIIDMPLWISSDLRASRQSGRDPDGHRRRAGDSGDDPRRLLREALGKRKMMVAAVAAGVLFYLGLILFHGRTALLALQLFNAILSA